MIARRIRYNGQRCVLLNRHGHTSRREWDGRRSNGFESPRLVSDSVALRIDERAQLAAVVRKLNEQRERDRLVNNP